MGAYTDSLGIELVRKNVSKFICTRDNTDFNINPKNIMLT